MKKVRVNAIYGKMINADGQWLSCIGNIPLRVGDYVWSDGRCAYGNVIEGGEPFIAPVQNLEGIPLNIAHEINNQHFDFYIDSNAILRHFSTPYYDGSHLFINNKSSVFYIDRNSWECRDSYLLDVDIASNNDIWAIFEDGNILKNGKFHSSYSDIIDNTASEFYDSLSNPSDFESPKPEDKIIDTYIMFAFIDSDGSYRLIFVVNAKKESSPKPIPDQDQSNLITTSMGYGIYLINNDKTSCIANTCVTQSFGQEVKTWWDEIYNIYHPKKDYYTLTSYQAMPSDLKFPIGDGWHITITAPENIISQSNTEPSGKTRWGAISTIDNPYIAYVFDNNNKLQFYTKSPEIDTFLYLRVCPISKNKFIINNFYAPTPKEVYNDDPQGWKYFPYAWFPAIISVNSLGSEAKLVDYLHTKINGSNYWPYSIYNARLRKMKDINKFKRAAKILKTMRNGHET